MDIDIPIESASLEVSIYNVIGELTHKRNIPTSGKQTLRIQTNGLPDGVYILVVQGDGILLSEKFIVHHP